MLVRPSDVVIHPEGHLVHSKLQSVSHNISNNVKSDVQMAERAYTRDHAQVHQDLLSSAGCATEILQACARVFCGQVRAAHMGRGGLDPRDGVSNGAFEARAKSNAHLGSAQLGFLRTRQSEWKAANAAERSLTPQEQKELKVVRL